MAASPETVSMAMFCDFENVALGVRDAKYEKFDIKPVLERLLLKGSIVLKKAYCDWDRYKAFKATMHEANFELIEIPHLRQSGKNSADIRMVVDALDLCYTKSHVNTFVIVSGDSDFSPLVSKLRENAKYVIGVGVKQSTSDLLIANCDEFIFYDDLVRENQRSAARRDPKAAQPIAKRSPEELEARRSEAVELAVSTFEALLIERGDSSKIWASMLKEAIKRRKPDFNESYFGFRAFGNLLEEAQARGLLELGRDEKSGAFVSRGSGTQAQQPAEPQLPVRKDHSELPAEKPAAKSVEKRRGRGGKKAGGAAGAVKAVIDVAAQPELVEATPDIVAPVPQVMPVTTESAVEHSSGRKNTRQRTGRNAAKNSRAEESKSVRPPEVIAPAAPVVSIPPAPAEKAESPALKPVASRRRPRKAKAESGETS